MILYNHVKQDVETDNHWLPAIHVDGPDTALLSFINGHTGVTGTFAQGAPTATQGDIMASFSSRGPSAYFLKPDITAPGIQVLAGMTPQPDPLVTSNGPAGNLFQAIAGTSMSAPHVGGSAVLVKAAHPSWTPAEIKSAMMTSAAQDVIKEDGVTPATPFDSGAGGLRVNRAVNPTVVFNETFANYVASGADPLGRVNLNLPSIDATTMSGELTTHRTAINVSGTSQRLMISTQAPAGATITVGISGHSLSIGKDASLTFPITISAPSLPDGQYFGRITLTPTKAGFNAVTIPVAFNKKQGTVTLSQNCAPTTFQVTGHSHCSATVTNLASTPANVNLTVSGKGLDYTNVTPPATAISNGFTWSGTLTPSVAPQVVSITPSGSPPAGGYLPLSAFGIAPLGGVGDETISNLDTNAFLYGGESYNRIGVVSNGYLVVGGGNSSDINFQPQIFPDPARPNNVIAPFWTDLDPCSGGAIRVGELTDGTTTWIVVDWGQVFTFGDTVKHSFEIWLQEGTNPLDEGISIEYGVNGDGASSGTNWGAENRDGSSGKNIPTQPADNTSWAVTLTGPTPGGHQTFQYDVSANHPGTYVSMAAMTSNLTAGTTEVPVTLNVTRRLDRFKVGVSPSPVAVGTNQVVTATAIDSGGSTLAGYSGPATISDLSGGLSVVTPFTWTGGVGTATVKYASPFHADRVTVTDGGGSSPAVSSKSDAFNVTGPVDHFKVTAPDEVGVGESFTVRFSARDALNDTVAGYAGPVTLTDLSGALTIESAPTWTDGVGTATVSVGHRFSPDRITVTDASGIAPPPSGRSGPISVGDDEGEHGHH